MDNENKWEYDYSSANSSSGETGYPNVGSTGMNLSLIHISEPTRH